MRHSRGRDPAYLLIDTPCLHVSRPPFVRVFYPTFILASVYLPASITPTTLANCGAVSSYQHALTATTSTTPTL